MKSAPRCVVRVVLASFATVGLVTPASAQDPCPSASGADAEAGWAAYQDGDMTRAHARFEAAIARCDNDHYARTGLGYVALRDGDTSEAAGLFEVVVLAEPNNVDALVGLGLGSWRTGDLDAVERHFGRVVQLAPDHPTAIEFLERVSGARRPEQGPRDDADRAWLAGDTENALVLYSARLDEDPTDGTALLRAGLIRAWNGQYAASLELLGLLIDQQPTNVDGLLARARVRAWSGDIPAAEREVRRILGVQPDHADALAALALFQSWSGRLDEALASYDQLLSIAPEHATGQRQQAQAMAWASRSDESLAAFEALVRNDPDDVEARFGLARSLAFAGRHDEAVGHYDRILAAVPGEMRALTGRARTLGWAGRLVESERAAVHAVDVDRASAAAWATLGQVYRMEGRNGAALEALTTASGLAPTDPEIRDQLRSLRLSLAPVARPVFTAEQDSDENRMLTVSASSAWYLTPRLNLRAAAYRRSVEQTFPTGTLSRSAAGVSVTGGYELGAGWLVTGSVGGSMTDGTDDPRFGTFSVGGRTPLRYPFGAALTVSSSGLDETAALAQRGIRASELLVSVRWNPGPLWRVDANAGIGTYSGTEDNGRRSAYFGASRRLGRFSLGASLRGFSFEKNLSDGYFDPDFYGVAEITTSWLYRPLPWTVLVEVAPGVQQITSDGTAGTSIRSNTRVAYAIAPGREVSLSAGYSSAGLTSFATGDSGYSYQALILGFNWVF